MANVLSLLYYGGAGPGWAALAADDKIFFQQTAGALDYGATATGPIPVDSYNGGMHIISAANADVCLTNHQPALGQGSTAAKFSVNGVGDMDISAIAPLITQCLNIHAACSPNAAITAASFFAFKPGGAETVAPDNCTIKGLLYGETDPWADIGGSAAAIDMQASASAATHDRYVGLTVVPTANGALTATLKFSETFV